MTLRQFPNVEQRSDEWYALRRGVVTASCVGQLITSKTLTAIDYECRTCGAQPNNPCMSTVPKKAGATLKTLHPERAAGARERGESVLAVAKDDDSRGLTMQLIAERISGHTEENYVSNDMMRGIMCEPIARDIYAKHSPDSVVEVGFMRRDEDGWRLGYSPDGLVGDGGLLEIKAPRAKTHIRTVLADQVPAQYMAQCQAGLLVTGRSWIDFVSFHGGLPLFTKRVEPDPAWFTAIEDACRQFEQNANATVADWDARIVGLPPTERIDTDMEIVI